LYTAKAAASSKDSLTIEKDLLKKGRDLLQNDFASAKKLEVLAENVENSQRKVEIVKAPEAWRSYQEMIVLYAMTELMTLAERKNIGTWKELQNALPANPQRHHWLNIGGQLVPEPAIRSLIKSVRSNRINSWDRIHEYYQKKSKQYQSDKLEHALATLWEVQGLSPSKFTKKKFAALLAQSLVTREKIYEGIVNSRTKDYQNRFRKMVYDNDTEMEKVIGKLSDNSFIRQQASELELLRNRVQALQDKFGL
jgi:hypothetical protein